MLAVLRQRPILSLPQLCQLSAMTFPTANKTMALLVDAGIARELTGFLWHLFQLMAPRMTSQASV